MPTTQELNCSFCLRAAAEVDALLAGPSVHICNRCVETCVEILAGQSSPPVAALGDMDDDRLLASLSPAAAQLRAVHRGVRRHVALLRERGVSWATIGSTLGISRQAAWERFSGEE